jgi:Competence protein J (ComJ)
MHKKASFTIPGLCGFLYVWPGFLENIPEWHNWYSHTGLQEDNQGFVWTSSIICLSPDVGGYGSNNTNVEVYEADDISLCPDAVRAILLPLSISEGGLAFANSFHGTRDPIQMVPFPPGNYALLVEIRDSNAINQTSRFEDWEEETKCLRLTLIPKEEEVEPEILRLDRGLAPYPLLMGPAKKATFELDIQNRQFLVWSHSIPPHFMSPPLTEELMLSQGFASTPQAISFATFREKAYSKIIVEVYQSGKRVHSGIGRILSLPFSVEEGEIIVSNLKGEQAQLVPLTPGRYELVFELSHRPYLRRSHPEYQKEPEAGCQVLWCRLTLIPISAREAVIPRCLVNDMEALQLRYPFCMGT